MTAAVTLLWGESLSGVERSRRAHAASDPTFAAQRVYAVIGTPSPQATVDELLEVTAPAIDPTHWIWPRFGTQSPWSSKATELLGLCGITGLIRVERGLALRTSGRVAALFDRMTETCTTQPVSLAAMAASTPPRPLGHVPLGADPVAALTAHNRAAGLALAEDEIAYLAERYAALSRDPTDAELMMFAQANSEHCRHKIFNAQLHIAGQLQPDSLFAMIRKSTAASPTGVLSAYRDNAAVFAGGPATHLMADSARQYSWLTEDAPILLKAETHNHPTAISPYPGAATGAGGEIRDEGATGRGGVPKAGFVSYCVSHLRLPDAAEAWEGPAHTPDRIATPLQIMIEAPLGAAAFNNEFGRPALIGSFRTFELAAGGRTWGFHKPILLAGGLGTVRPMLVEKNGVPAGAAIIVLGGPAMLIGLGGGAASSVHQGGSHADLDFASVQRDNAEMQRRCQEVITRCCAMGAASPILSVHDVGAGGLCNAIPEVLHGAGRGGVIDLDRVPSAEPGLSPMEIWCNEAQERYVLALAAGRVAEFAALCERERAPWAHVGVATDDGQLIVTRGGERVTDLPLSMILDKPPRMVRHSEVASSLAAPMAPQLSLREALWRVLGHPAVADKTFLVTIGDRTVGGLVHRDAMVGPRQVPVADCAITLADFVSTRGEAMALGEKAPLALLDGPAAARMAVGEALLGLAAARIGDTSAARLSCNWMAAASVPGEDARLHASVRAVGEQLAPALGIAIPVGKDSMSMRTAWRDGELTREVVGPVTLMVTAVAPVDDVRDRLVPLGNAGDALVLLAPTAHTRLGGSVLAQVVGQPGDVCPDLDDAAQFRAFVAFLQRADVRARLHGYHDRSDGGLIAAALEIAFASGTGVAVDVAAAGGDAFARLFAEDLGVLVALAPADVPSLIADAQAQGFAAWRCGDLLREPTLRVRTERASLEEPMATWRARWSHVSDTIAATRDNPECVAEGQRARATGATTLAPVAPVVVAPAVKKHRPRVAILREQGVNGQQEMAAAFTLAGFDAIDVHMTDLHAGRDDLSSYQGLAACGGFSYGDVLGAGRGWASSVLHAPRVRDAFAKFFARTDTFTLGACNGCQFLAHLSAIIPGATHFPRWRSNRSGRYEARLILARVEASPSLLLRGMHGWQVPLVVAHGEGRAAFATPEAQASTHAALRYVDAHGAPSEQYPVNPSGTPDGIAGVCSDDGRVTIVMPHVERVFRSVQLSWAPPEWGEFSPWMQVFWNARALVA